MIIAGADVSRLNKYVTSEFAISITIFQVFVCLRFKCLSFLLLRHEQTPVDEAAIGGKMNVIDAINTAVAEVELTRASV